MARRLFIDEGLSAAQVAEALGGGLSRGAVIGKMRRLGICKQALVGAVVRKVEVRTPRRTRRAPADDWMTRRSPTWPPRPLPPLREAPAHGSPAILACLAAGACHWPLDDPGAGRMHATLFCAAPAGDGTYCPAHEALARRPGTGRPRP
jgi:GcrA cell cycle regulator